MFVSQGHKMLFPKFRNVREDKSRRRLASKLKKSSSLAKYIDTFSFIIKIKISQILETKFYVFCTQICRKWTKFFT